MYDPDVAQRTSGQISFRQALKNNFGGCWATINKYGFQTGWKKITNRPQNGNYNPNWKDCLDFVSAAIENDLHVRVPCPDLPIMHKLPNIRSRFTHSGYWYHMFDVCTMYKEAVKVDTSAKRNGTIAAMYQDQYMAVPKEMVSSPSDVYQSA